MYTRGARQEPSDSAGRVEEDGGSWPEELAPPPLRLTVAEIDRLADEIAEIAVHVDAATHRLLACIRRFDESGGWAVQGALSCAHWLCWRIGLELGAAREHVRVARALGGLPRVDAALARGAVSFSKVRAISRVATPRNEEALLHQARCSTAAQLERICRAYRRVVGASGETPEQEEARRWVRSREVRDGMVRVEALLRPEEAALVMRAIEAVQERAWRERGTRAKANSRPIAGPTEGPTAAPTSGMTSGVQPEKRSPPAVGSRSPGRRAGARSPDGAVVEVSAEISRDGAAPSRAISRADALVAMAEASLAGGKPSRGSPIELVVHVAGGRGCLEDGTPLPAATLDRLRCDATVAPGPWPWPWPESKPAPARCPEPCPEPQRAEEGRRIRTLPGRLRRALRSRDGGCRFPGCTSCLTDGHHVRPWSAGGPTTLENLVSLCRRHHRFVHEHGYAVALGVAGAVHFRRPDGVAVRKAPEPPSLGEAAIPAALRDLAPVDAGETVPRWDGARVDYGLAVEALLYPAGVAVSAQSSQSRARSSSMAAKGAARTAPVPA